MKLDKKVYWILGIVLLIVIIGICWMVCRPKAENITPNENGGNVVQNQETNTIDFIVNNLGVDADMGNKSIDFNSILKKVKAEHVKDLKGIANEDIDIRVKVFEVDHLEYSYAVDEKEDSYTEIWLAKTSMREDNMILEGFIRRADDFRFSKINPEIIIKEEAGIAMLIISNKASEIEKTIDSEITKASEENKIINLVTEATVSETETVNDSVTATIKVAKENIEKVEIFAGEHMTMLYDGIEATYNEEKQAYEVEVKFDSDREDGIYQIAGIITDTNGNRVIVSFPEVMRMPKEMAE